MISAELKESFLSLVRLGIGHSIYSPVTSVDWYALKALAEKHGLSAVLLDGIDKCQSTSKDSEVSNDQELENSRIKQTNTNGTNLTNGLPLELKLEWIGEVLQAYEGRYEQYKKAIGTLAGWHNANGFKMMVLKGYACSLDWPRPEHRPCGDIDIWQFGRQKEADETLLKANTNRTNNTNKFEIDNSHHHHTVFEWDSFSVENHYDFLNVYHHKSNVEMESILKELGNDDSHFVELNGEKVYLPSANLHALFLLRHSMSNFASTGFQLRQLLDWAFFVEKHYEEIDWEWLESQLEHFGMKKLYDVFNAICVGDLGFDVKLFPKVQFQPELKDRVLNDILTPEFSEKESGGFISRAVFKYRRWRANEWKHELCFNDSLWSAFWSGVWGHLIKPSSI